MSQSTILSEGRETVLPATPTDKQIFVDSERVRWVYDAETEVWERAGTVENIPLANATTTGLMSSQDKALLDGVPEVGGGFGIIVDAKMVLQTASNPEGVIKGDVKLRSDSLDIICVGADRLKLKCQVPPQLECSSSPGSTSTPGRTSGTNRGGRIQG